MWLLSAVERGYERHREGPESYFRKHTSYNEESEQRIVPMNLRWQRIRDPLYAVGLGLTSLLILIVLVVLFAYWTGNWNATEAQVIVGGLGGLGTLLLASGTFLSLWHNEREVENLRKEREKPIVADEIRNFIQPAINRLESDIQDIEQHDREIDWHYVKMPDSGFSGGLPHSVIYRQFTEDNKDETAMKRFQEDAPELWDLVIDREATIEEGVKISDRIEAKIRPLIEEYIQENDIENRNEETPNIDVLLSSTLRDIDSYGENHEDYEVWENHRQEFRRILHKEAEDDYEQLMAKEDDIHGLTKELREELLSRKVALREEYGISSEEIETGDPVPRAV